MPRGRGRPRKNEPKVATLSLPARPKTEEQRRIDRMWSLVAHSKSPGHSVVVCPLCHCTYHECTQCSTEPHACGA